MSNKTVIIIPTYNELQNIDKMIKEINSLGLSADILIVDDNSPDGTGNEVDELKKKIHNLDIIRRKQKEGIGPAYIEGFRYVLKNGSYDFIIQMDADFSHNPKDIPRLLEEAKNSDVVVGSRYIADGGVSNRWGNLRKAISKFGNIYARCITGVGVHDMTAGFKCYNSRVLEKVDLDRIFLNGYGFQVQILYEIAKRNFTIKEIPIFFDERTKDRSKMHLGIVAEAFFLLPLARVKSIFKK